MGSVHGCGLSGAWRALGAGVLLLAGAGEVQGERIVELAAFPVYAGSGVDRGAAGSIQLSEWMAREARVDLQGRGGPRYQTDIVIRGGIFEGSGVQVGGLALFDPQTGHYFAEVPLDPGFFAGAELLTGTANALRGFNATAGSVNWAWAPVEAGGVVYGSVGSNAHRGGGARLAGRAGERTWYELGVARARGDGSIAGGDYDLVRVSGRVEGTVGGGWLRVFGGHTEKFYGWPGMYTGRSFLNETEDYAVTLTGFEWRGGGSGAGWHRLGGYWRHLEDSYEFRREAPAGLFAHATEVWSVQGDGSWELDAAGWGLDYRWVLLRDRIRRSTSLAGGPFTSRDYAKAGALARRFWRSGDRVASLYGGATVDHTSEDGAIVLPQAGVRMERQWRDIRWEAYGELSKASRVPGYTALNSPPLGLFGGNPDLGRERARTLEVGIGARGSAMAGRLVAFERRDRELADWVFSSASPSLRRAEPLDLRVRGLEAWLRAEAGLTAVELGYAVLDKAPHYRNPQVDASYYALNYARHRLLAMVEQGLPMGLELRLEGEFRRHPANPLRGGSDEALRLHAEAAWLPLPDGRWRLAVRLENLTKDRFEPFPGTPGPGREAIATLTYVW